MSISPDLKTRWIEALRSGEYTQCRAKFHCPDGSYCALGVLLHLENVPDEMLDNFSFTYTDERTGEPTYHIPLSEWMKEELGLEKQIQDAIVRCNDTDRSTFEEIANFLEERRDI